MKRPRIVLAEDYPVALEGIRSLLAPHYEIAGAVTDGRALLEAALRLKPDLIITDITMPRLNGIDAAIQIQASLPGTKVLFFTMHSSSSSVRAAFEAGGTGYVLKSGSLEELLDAVQSVLSDRIYVSPGPSTAHAEPFQDSERAATFRLSMRERETLQLIAEGRAAKEIAHIMSVSVKTVAFHRQKIKRKLGLRTAAELTKKAIEIGLVQ